MLPIINISSITSNYKGVVDKGTIVYEYNPLQNLNSDNGLTNLRLDADIAQINIKNPVDINCEFAYDSSANIIINDEQNPLKLINSRFIMTSSTSYTVADRKGDLDTNIYSKEHFRSETSLIKNVSKIIKVDLDEIKSGGNLRVGNYNFYFKLADSDGNETDIVAESGQVVCYIGEINKPDKIRGGQAFENSQKIVSLKLGNLDLGYPFINIYYSISTNNATIPVTQYFKILDKYKITSDETIVTITGFENTEEIVESDLNLRYANFDSVKSSDNCQNMTFAANITNNYEIYEKLEDLSLRISPQLAQTTQIGNLSDRYVETSISNGYEYYNPDNIYYRLGY